MFTLFLLPLLASAESLRTSSSILCRILQVHDLLSDASGEIHCEINERQQYVLNFLPDEFHTPAVFAGEEYLRISHARIVNETLVASPNTQYSVQRQRRQLQVLGTRTISVIRVSTTDKSPTQSVATMRKIVDDSTNAKTQMNACAHGATMLVSKGVHNVYLSQRLSSYSSAIALVNEATEKLRTHQQADHTLFCLPPGTPGDWIARANSNHWRSWYNDEWCTSLSAAMHEIG